MLFVAYRGIYWIAKDYVCFDSIGFLYFPTVTANGYDLQKISVDTAIFNAFLPLSIEKNVNVSSIGDLYRFLGLLESILTPAATSKDTAAYEKLILLMKKNPHLTIPEYAELNNISESLLYRYVKKATGKSPNRLRQEILCQKATELLCATDYTIEEICDRLGFSSAAYFRKVFEAVYKKSPSQMRKERKMV